MTKDIPLYAIAAGNSAEIIEYRFPNDIIKKLLQIEWRNWEDKNIKECHSDFYLKADDFIKKYYNSEV